MWYLYFLLLALRHQQFIMLGHCVAIMNVLIVQYSILAMGAYEFNFYTAVGIKFSFMKRKLCI